MSKTVYKVCRNISGSGRYSAANNFVYDTYVKVRYYEGLVNMSRVKKYPWLFVFDNEYSAISFCNRFIPSSTAHYEVWECSTPRISTKLPKYARPEIVYPSGTIFCKKLTLNKLVYTNSAI